MALAVLTANARRLFQKYLNTKNTQIKFFHSVLCAHLVSIAVNFYHIGVHEDLETTKYYLVLNFSVLLLILPLFTERLAKPVVRTLLRATFTGPGIELARLLK